MIQKLLLAALIVMDQLTYFAAVTAFYNLYETFSVMQTPDILHTHSNLTPLHLVTI